MELIKIENGYLLDEETSAKLREFELMAKEIKKKEEELKEAIKEQMELLGITKLETDDLTISYIAPTKKETFDSKKLREDNPDLYDLYVKLSDVRSSIRIKLK